MATGGVEKINRLVGKIISRTHSATSPKTDFRDYMPDAPPRTRPREEREDTVTISHDANKFARMAKELADIRNEVMKRNGREEYAGDGNPYYLEDSASAYNVMRARLGAKLAKYPVALNADTEILNVVLERSIADEARALAQSADLHMFSQYITHGENMLRERLAGISQKFLKSFFYLLNVMEPDKAEEAASALVRKIESPSLEQLSYSDIARMKEFGKANRSLSLGAKWNMLSRDGDASDALREHFAMLYQQSYGKRDVSHIPVPGKGFFVQS